VKLGASNSGSISQISNFQAIELPQMLTWTPDRATSEAGTSDAFVGLVLSLIGKLFIVKINEVAQVRV
jgi:hypothetical protein